MFSFKPYSPILVLSLTLAALLYLAAWGWHLYADTAVLRGFWGDGSLEFLAHLSRSYIFTNEPPNLGNIWVHLFPVGNPRDGALFLNALGLQAALWLNITDPATLKYIFVFWQYALPGFLYLGLFFALWRAGRASWIVFPLLSWAVCSVPVDWNAVNNTRWAVPVFWMHVCLCLHAKPRDRLGAERWPLLALGILAVLMWAGLYESVAGQLGLLAAAGGYIWWREGNNRPFLYALAALPGAVRAFMSYLATGRDAQNGLHGLTLPALIMHHPYGALMALVFISMPLQAVLPHRWRRYLYILLAACFAYFAVWLWLTPPLPIWVQVNIRFDYIAEAMVLMLAAAACRCFHFSPRAWAAPSAIIGLCIGALFWSQQTAQTSLWKACMSHYAAQKSDKPLIVDTYLAPLIQPRDGLIQVYNHMDAGGCLWDWTTPWEDLLTAPDGRVTQWPLFAFWQDFSFIQRAGQVYLHTNNWTLNSPSIQESEEDLPLKTALYDLTPLYEKVGLGPLFPRAHCMPVAATENNWHHHLSMLNDKKREQMFVCPRRTDLLLNIPVTDTP